MDTAFAPPFATSVWSNRDFDPMIGTSPVTDLDPPSERAKMVATVAAAVKPDTLARGAGEFAQHLRRVAWLPEGWSMAWARSASVFA